MHSVLRTLTERNHEDERGHVNDQRLRGQLRHSLKTRQDRVDLCKQTNNNTERFSAYQFPRNYGHFGRLKARTALQTAQGSVAHQRPTTR
jgi:hypothetical protein